MFELDILKQVSLIWFVGTKLGLKVFLLLFLLPLKFLFSIRNPVQNAQEAFIYLSKSFTFDIISNVVWKMWWLRGE